MDKKISVKIEKERIVIGDKSIEYYPYYFAIWTDGIDHRLTVKKTLSQWASALATMRSSGLAAVYLPYYLDDETCRFLKADADGEELVLTDLLVRDAGWDMNLDDLSRVMYSEPEVIDRLMHPDGRVRDEIPMLFGRYNAGEIIYALENAEIAG